jgi:hypothetical protein
MEMKVSEQMNSSIFFPPTDGLGLMVSCCLLTSVFHHSGLNGTKSDLAPSRYTDTGMPVYKLHAINFLNRKGGRTPQCPFDCKCCY